MLNSTFSIPTEEEYLAFCSEGMRGVLGVDSEGTGLNVKDGRDYGYGISVAYWSRSRTCVVSMYFPIRHTDWNVSERVFQELKKLIETAEVVATHNIKFDIPNIASMGIHIRPDGFMDTVQMAHLLDEMHPMAKSLEACSTYYLKDSGKEKSEQFNAWLKAFGWHNPMPVSMMWEYACKDAELVYRLYRVLEEKWSRQEPELWDYWNNFKREFTWVVLQMEMRGVRVDTNLCEHMIKVGEARMDELLYLMGEENLGPKALTRLLLEQLGLPIVKPTPGGKPSFDKDAMEEYDQILERRDSDLAQWILEYRGWQKSVSSNYRAYLELLSPDGRLRPNYKLHGTKTGRMSCEKPNLQQIPRVTDKDWNGQMKQAFIPAPGFKLYEADYSQLELRVATAYANEEGLKQVFAEGRDIFTEMAQTLGMPRHDTKTLVYTIQYGGGITRLKNVFNITQQRAQQIRDNFYNEYPGFRKISRMAQNVAKAKGTVAMWTKRKRHFKWPDSEAHKAFNAVVQGGSADIVAMQMVKLWNEVDNDAECRMLLQVHDSVVFEIKEGREDYYLPKIKEIMENIDQWSEKVKFAVDVHEWGVAS